MACSLDLPELKIAENVTFLCVPGVPLGLGGELEEARLGDVDVADLRLFVESVEPALVLVGDAVEALDLLRR